MTDHLLVAALATLGIASLILDASPVFAVGAMLGILIIARTSRP